MTGPSPAATLFRELLRQTKQLPAEAQAYYKRYIRQTFINFTDEQDPERVAQLVERARQDAQWVVAKVRGGWGRGWGWGASEVENACVMEQQQQQHIHIEHTTPLLCNSTPKNSSSSSRSPGSKCPQPPAASEQIRWQPNR